MPEFRVTSRYLGSLDIEASNWLAALGQGLEQFGLVRSIERLSVEVLRDGQVLARDRKTNHGYLVQELDDGYAADPDFSAESEIMDLEPLSVREEIDEILLAPTIQKAARHVVDALAVLIPSECASVLLCRADGTLAFIAAVGPGSETLGNISLPPGTGIVGHVVDRGVSIVVDDAYSDPRTFRAMDQVTGVTTRSLLCVPLIHQHRTLGCLELINSKSPGGYDRNALADAEIFAKALSTRVAEGVQKLPERS